MKKTVIVISVLLILSGVGVWAYGRFGKNEEKSRNFDDLLKNLNVVADAQGIASVKFNSGANTAQFYNNDRVIIFKGTTKIGSGSYYNGGLTITMDGKEPITSSSVFSNLLKTI